MLYFSIFYSIFDICYNSLKLIFRLFISWRLVRLYGKTNLIYYTDVYLVIFQNFGDIFLIFSWFFFALLVKVTDFMKYSSLWVSTQDIPSGGCEMISKRHDSENLKDAEYVEHTVYCCRNCLGYTGTFEESSIWIGSNR